MDWLRVGLAFHEKYRLYDFGAGHPFRGDRFGNSMRIFKKQGLLDLPDIHILKPEIAKLKDLLRVHNRNYVDLIFDFAEKGRAYDIDTPLNAGILEGALYIMGGALRVGDDLASGEINRGICLGGGLHHAGEDFGGGFCIFNDVAILARYLQQEKNIRRVLILDYDVHAGNGTSDIFYADPSVLFISVHQDPKTLFPGSGFVGQIGRGDGEGFNINVPLPPGTSNNTYFFALREVFVPLAREFNPDVILANGGSDPHFADILGSLSLTVAGFFNLSQLIVNVSKEVCESKAILHIGSGYNPAILPACWYALAAGIVGIKRINMDDPSKPPIEPPWCRERVETTIKELKKILKMHWKCFR